MIASCILARAAGSWASSSIAARTAPPSNKFQQRLGAVRSPCDIDAIHCHFFKSLRGKNAAAFFRLAEPHRRRRSRQLHRSIAVRGDRRRDDAQQIVILGPLGQDGITRPRLRTR